MYYLHITWPKCYIYTHFVFTKYENHTSKCDSLLVPTSHILVHCYNKLELYRAWTSTQTQNISHSPSDESNTHLPVTNSQIHYILWEIYIHIWLHFNLIASCFVWRHFDSIKIIEFHEAIKCVTSVSSSTFPTFGTKRTPHKLKGPTNFPINSRKKLQLLITLCEAFGWI
jgi:hypothetical protein